MSNWTHAAGIIRIDGIRCLEAEPDFESLIGRELHFEDSVSLWDESEEHPEKFLPLGSEGSLKMDIWKNPDPSSLAAYTVSIFGDLRNHDSADEIIDWFKNICKKFLVRQAVITVNNEWHGTKTYTFEEEK